MVTRLAVRRRYRGRIAAVLAARLPSLPAMVFPLSLGGGRITPAQGTAVIPFYATAEGKLHPAGSGRTSISHAHDRRRRRPAGGSRPGTLNGHFFVAVSARRYCRPEPPLGAVMPALARRLPVAIGAISSEAIPVRFTTGLTAGPRTRLRVRLTAVRRVGLRAGVAAMTSRS